MLFGLVALLLLLKQRDVASVAWLVALGAVAAASSRRQTPDRTTQLLLVAEASLAALGGVFTGGTDSPLLAYLPAPTLAAGILLGLEGAILTTGLGAVVVLLGRARFDDPDELRSFTSSAAQWVVLSLATGVLGNLLRDLLHETKEPPAHQRYTEAYHLLGQLRAVTRRLPGSLDPTTVATKLLQECRVVTPFTRGAVFMQTGGGEVLVPLAMDGMRRVPWRLSLDEPGPVGAAWGAVAPVLDERQPDRAGRRRGSRLLVLPVVVEERPVGVVVLESLTDDEFTPAAVEELSAVVQAAGLPLETAALFDELRLSAATEERQRLAREMHDGIAQDLAYLGFELDGLHSGLRKSGDDVSAGQALDLRQRITALISELRLSISDLRSSIGPARGLGAALTEYARSVGTSTGMTVHLELSEGAVRLPADTEVQLLRIAHEAMGSARRRRGARNLWVTLVIDPPGGSLVIEDDGENDGALKRDAIETEVMLERAQRIHATLQVAQRHPNGVCVSVVLGRDIDADGPAG
jgi:signal transduction histidine kinase